MLSVRNGTRAIEFHKAAFGAHEVFRVDNEKREVVAQLSLGRAKFWLADERAVAAGAKAVSRVGNQHGWRVGRVVDPFGHQRLASPCPKELLT